MASGSWFSTTGKRLPRCAAPQLPGRSTLILLGLWVAFSCSRLSGLPKLEGLPQITLERLAFGALLATALVNVALRKGRMGPCRLAELGLWAVAAHAAISGVLQGAFSSGYAGAGVGILLNLLVLPALAYSLVLRTRWAGRDVRGLFFILCGFGLYLGLTAVLERSPLHWAVLPAEIVDPRLEHHWGRARGPFIQAEFNATVMVLLLPVTLFLSTRRGATARAFGLLAAGLLCLGVYLTETRAALISLVVVLAIGSAARGGQRSLYVGLAALLVVAGVALAVLGFPVVPRLDEVGPIYDRFKLLSVTFSMIGARPIAGIGYGNFDLQQEAFFDPTSRVVAAFTEGAFWSGGTHNTLLTPFAELGVLAGSLLLLLVLRVPWAGLVRSFRAGAPGPEPLLLCCTLVGVAYVVNAVFVELRYTLTPNALFWIAAALLDSPPRLDSPRPGRPS